MPNMSSFYTSSCLQTRTQALNDTKDNALDSES